MCAQCCPTRLTHYTFLKLCLDKRAVGVRHGVIVSQTFLKKLLGWNVNAVRKHSAQLCTDACECVSFTCHIQRKLKR